MAHVFIPAPVHESGPRLLRARGHEVTLLDSGDDTAPSALTGAQALLVRTLRVDAALLEALPALRVVAKHGTGVDNIDLAAARSRGVRVVNAPEANSRTVAEWSLGALVALARDFRGGDQAVRTGDWQVRESLAPLDLAGKTLGIIGLGRIGTLLARKAVLGLDMKVLAHDPFKTEPGPLLEGLNVRLASREEVLGASDFVALHLPGGPSNRNSFGAAQFAATKPGAFLINACRGEVVDEAALHQALTSGHLRGAALDVFAQEPPPLDHPLLQLPNVLATPHNAALTAEAAQRMSHDAALGIAQVLDNEPPTWPVG